MDLLEQVKKYVLVMEGENPMMNKEDALRIAERAGVLYRYARNGPVYEVRWSSEHPIMRVPEPHLCSVLMERIVEVNAPSAEKRLYDLDAEVGLAEVYDKEKAKMDEEIVLGPLPDATHAAYVLAEEAGVALEEVTPTGVDGKITKGDVQAYLDSQAE